MSNTREIEERAALWVLRQEEPGWSAADQAQLDDWLAQSYAHKAAFWRLEHGWREADRIASIGTVSQVAERRFEATAWFRPFAAAASLLLVAVLFALQGPNPPFFGKEQVKTIAYATAVGGHQVVALPDGSRVELNTDTAIKAAVSDRRRAVWLERGEAYFEVAKHPRSEFVIYAGPRTVTVLGTKFSVRRTDAKLVVGVIEGSVRVEEASADGSSQRSATMTAGDLAFADQRSTVVTGGSAEAVQQLLAWRSGKLLFDGTTLAEAAAQFNRYNRTQLVIEGPAAGRIRIGGSFEARNVDAFARLLNQAYGLNVSVREAKILVSS